MSEYGHATTGSLDIIEDDGGLDRQRWSRRAPVVGATGRRGRSPHNSRIQGNEVFSPAVTVTALDDEAEAVQLANEQPLGATLTKHLSVTQPGRPVGPNWVPPCRDSARPTERPPATSRAGGDQPAPVTLPAPLSCQEEAILRAVHAGRVEISCSREPDMFVDGINCCHQATARRMFHEGWVQRAHSGLATERVRAGLTAAGRAVARLTPPPQPQLAAVQDVELITRAA